MVTLQDSVSAWTMFAVLAWLESLRPKYPRHPPPGPKAKLASMLPILTLC
jgi:hypothetical protein